jgi:hypothetical protein
VAEFCENGNGCETSGSHGDEYKDCSQVMDLREIGK